jgi:hypothetical protein
MNRLQDSKKVLGQRRKELVEKWGKKILCCKPSAQQIRAQKKTVQKRRQDSRNIIADQDEYIKEVLKQEKEMREYKS